MNGRRTFLRQLAALPLIGGGVTLVGKPTGVAEPITTATMEAYKTWLEYERRSVAWELADHPAYVANRPGDKLRRYRSIEGINAFVGRSGSYHHHSFGPGPAAPSSRAALVLSTVGCDYRDDEGIFKSWPMVLS